MLLALTFNSEGTGAKVVLNPRLYLALAIRIIPYLFTNLAMAFLSLSLALTKPESMRLLSR